MSHSRHPLSRLVGATLVVGVISLAACDEVAPRTPLGARPPAEATRPSDDPRIGAGLPAEVRVVGTEHNRLTLAVLRKNRGLLGNFTDDGARCASILDGLTQEMPASAAAAAIPQREGQLRAILRGAMARNPRCAARVTEPTLAEVIGDGEVTQDGDPDAMLSDAAFTVIDEMIRGLGTAASEADANAVLRATAAKATTLRPADALAVQSAVSQSQGSLVLWAADGAGWEELRAPYEAQSILRSSRQQIEFVPGIAGALVADLAGCRAALELMRALPVMQDPRMLMAACGIGAAAATLYYAYTIYHME